MVVGEEYGEELVLVLVLGSRSMRIPPPCVRWVSAAAKLRARRRSRFALASLRAKRGGSVASELKNKHDEKKKINHESRGAPPTKSRSSAVL